MERDILIVDLEVLVDNQGILEMTGRGWGLYKNGLEAIGRLVP